MNFLKAVGAIFISIGIILLMENIQFGAVLLPMGLYWLHLEGR